MVEDLLLAQVIDAELHSVLLDLNRYRNLVFHGHVQSVDRQKLDQLKEVLARVRKIMEALG
jgi:uncharacterized protein YutE (UPF0331/DUF86 family)